VDAAGGGEWCEAAVLLASETLDRFVGGSVGIVGVDGTGIVDVVGGGGGGWVMLSRIL